MQTPNKQAATCELKSVCREEADREFFNGLFAQDWEVFVIRRDEASGRHTWFTLCCDEAMPKRHADA